MSTAKKQPRGQVWCLKPNLPDDIIERILCKLPISSLLRARAVCKSWKAKVDCAGFRRFYDLNCSREHRWLIVSDYGAVISMYNSSLDRWFQVPLPPKRLPPKRVVSGGTGGLLLLDRGGQVLIVGNPLRNDWKELPPLPVHRGYAMDVATMVEGADASSYKIVVFIDVDGCKTPLVYDSQLGLWSAKRSMEVIESFSSTTSVVCGSVIYAISFFARYVMVYDVESGNFGCVRVAKEPQVEVGEGDLPCIAPWRGEIFMFGRLKNELVFNDNSKHRGPLGVWLLCKDRWVLLSRSPRHLVEQVVEQMVRGYEAYDFKLWLDGHIVKLFFCGSSYMLTYNLAVAHSWSVIRTCRPPLCALCVPVYMPLSFAAAP